MHEQDPRRHENVTEPEACAAAELVTLARLMGRLAAREGFAASSAKEDERDEEAG